MGFLAVLMMLFMYLALIGVAVSLAMRNALIYVTALLAPLVFASSVLPLFRESARKVVHLGVALVFSKLAIVATLALATKMLANATDLTPSGDALTDGVGSLGVLFAAVVCFAVASFTPMVLYKLMPTVEGAVVGTGIAGGWGRSAMAGMYAATTIKGLAAGGMGAASLATAPVALGVGSGATPGAHSSSGGSGGGAATTPVPGSAASPLAGAAAPGVRGFGASGGGRVG
jgi:hypothetical protein